MVDQRSIHTTSTTNSDSFHTADESESHNNRDSFVTADSSSIDIPGIDSHPTTGPAAALNNSHFPDTDDTQSIETVRAADVTENADLTHGEQQQEEVTSQFHGGSIHPQAVTEDSYMSKIIKTVSHMSGREDKESLRSWKADELSDELQRTRSRKSIVDVLSQRANEREQQLLNENDKSMDVESQRLYQEQIEGEEGVNNIPGTGIEIQQGGSEFASFDPNMVSWNGEDDPEHPRNWPAKRKWKVTFVVAFFTFVSPFSSTLMSPAAESIAEDFHVTNSTIAALMISVYILAWAIGPLFVAPLSEMYGRSIVLNVGIVMLFFFNLACALAKTTAQMCVFRFLAGISGSPPLSTGAGVMGDLFNNSERNKAMALYGLGPSLAPAIAPVVSGFIVENIGWRWVFWILTIFTGCAAFLGIFFNDETYAPTLLRRRCARLRKETGNPHLITIYDIANGETNWSKFEYNITRPLSLLFTHPMVLGLGSFMAFTYGFFYLMLVTFPGVYQKSYGWSLGVAGLAYIPLSVGFVAGILVITRVMDKTSAILKARNNGVQIPEHRLPALLVSGIGLPIALIWYGWSVEKRLMWFMSFVGTFLFGFSFVPVFQTIQNYLIDMNPRFGASAVGAATIFRSLFGFGFPLFADQMYAKLNYGWGNTMCAFIALALGIPFPLFCLKYGEKIRNATNRRMELHQAKRDAKNLIRLKVQMAEREAVLREAGRLPEQLAQKNPISSGSGTTEKEEFDDEL